MPKIINICLGGKKCVYRTLESKNPTNNCTFWLENVN